MKKIVSAALVASMVAGATFADVSIGINFRRGTNVFNNPNTSSNKVTYADLGDITGTDAFTFKANNEYAGITLNYNPISARADEKSGKAQEDVTAKTFWSLGNGVEYSAYMNPADWLQLKAGLSKDGIFYAEQCKKDTDDTNWSAAGKYAFLYKLGPTTKNSTAYFIDDLTSYQNGGTPYFFADFKLDDVAGGNMLIRASVADTGKNWLLTGNYNNKSAPTPGLMLAWKGEPVNVNLDIQSISNNDVAAGLFVSPLGLADGALQLTAGFSMSKVLDGEKEAVGKKVGTDGVTFYAADLRIRYVADALHISNCLNFTGATEDQMVTQAASATTARTGNSNIWDSLFVTYKVNDRITLTGNVQPQIAMGVKVGEEEETIIDLAVTPGIMYTVGKGAAITAGLHTTFADLTGKAAKDADTTIGVALPVIFRVKM